MNIRELQKNWDEFGKIDPLWAILTSPDFVEEGQYLCGRRPAGLAIGDFNFNNDGKEDIVSANWMAINISVILQ